MRRPRPSDDDLLRYLGEPRTTKELVASWGRPRHTINGWMKDLEARHLVERVTSDSVHSTGRSAAWKRKKDCK